MIIKDFKWVEIIHNESEIINNSSMYLIPLSNDAFKIIVVDDEGEKRTLESTGQDGKSAYQIAVELGYVGTEEQWLESLRGVSGKSAYEVALDNGFIGNENEWLVSLKGERGVEGLSAYEIAVNNGFTGTENEWLLSLRGDDGAQGLSAYQVALNEGYVGTEAQWLLSLKGDKGDNGEKGDKGDTGIKGDTGAAGTNAQSFVTKGNVPNYASLPSTGNTVNDAYFNEADNKIYVYNGTSFPPDGKGISVGEVPSTIRTWNSSDIGLTQGSVRLRNNGLYVVKPGQTSTVTSPELDSVVWELAAVNFNTPFRDYINPLLEVNGLALANGGNAPSMSRGRTISFLDVTFAQQLELIGDMLIQNIFYYTETNVFISTQIVNGKVFTPTIPPTAKKFKLSFYHVNNTQDVTQVELNALIVNCYSSNTTNIKDVINISKISEKVINDYNEIQINLGYGVGKELGRISLTNGQNSSSNTGIRTNLISVSTGLHNLIISSGYKISRVVNYKDGVFVGNNITLTGNNFTIDGTTTNQVRLVFDKIPDGTTIITPQEVIDFIYSLIPVEVNKLEAIYAEAKRIKDLPKTAYFENEQLVQLNTIDTEVNFDLTNRKINITGGALIDMGNTVVSRITLPTSNVDMPTAITAGMVLYNRTNNTIVVQTQTAPPLLNHYLLFTYRYSGAFSNFYVTGIKNYSVNGIPISQQDIRPYNKLSVDNFNMSYWNAPIQLAYDPTSLTSNMLYNMYDDIINTFPSSNVVKTIIGQTDGPVSYDVIRIDVSFNKKSLPTQRRRKPRIFICGGIHGGEKLCVYSTYLFFKYLLTNPDNDDILNILRTNYDWTFIPLVNPYALNIGQVGGIQSVRWNHNGVDINRNFDFRWADYIDGGPGSQSYKGTAPFSEKESQFVRDTFNNIKNDTVMYIDCHNFGSTGLADPRCVWFASTYDVTQNIIYSLCDRLDMELKKRWNYIPTNTLVAFSDIDGSSPMSQSWMSNQQILSATLETDQSDFFNTTDPSNFNSNVITRSLEVYVNSFYSLAKHAVNMYNTRFR